MSDDDFCDLIQMTKSEFRAIQNGQKSLGMSSLISLSKHFEISLDDLIYSKISVRKALKKTPSYKISLPEKFVYAANSKVRTSYHIINYLEQKEKFDLIQRKSSLVPIV